MGYEVHIIRKDEDDEYDEKSSITMEEWLEYVAGDKELNLTNGYQITAPNIDIPWKESPGFCYWTGHSEHLPAEALWFDFWNGIISAKYPDDETIKKMVSIAKALNAKVQGDDSEFYDDSYFDNKMNSGIIDTQLNFQSYPKNKPWWKFW